MDIAPAEPLRPDQPFSRTLEAFTVAVEGWIAAVEALDRFFQPMVEETPALQEQLQIIYQAHLRPWRERIDGLLPELGPNLLGKRQTVRRIAFQRQVRTLLEGLQATATQSLARSFPESKGVVPALHPIPGLDEVTRRFLQMTAGNGTRSPRTAKEQPPER